MTLFTFIEILGTLAFAISGIRLASAKRFDGVPELAAMLQKTYV